MEPETNATVLVVDDNENNRELLRALLIPEGYLVLTASNGVRALEMVGSGRSIDLVLLDVMMPDMDGIEVCEHIRQELGILTLPIVFVTALDDRRSRIRGKAAGGDDFLTKPVDDVELLVRVKNLVRVKAYHDLKEHQRMLVEKELDNVKERLLHAERLATLGKLAGSVGHELGNITGVFTGTMYFIKERFKI